MLLPSVLSFFVTWSFARKLPPSEVNVSLVTWWVCLFAVGVIVLLATERVTRGLLPLAALFKLSLVFPDEAPSRYGIALRTNSTRKLEKRIEEIRESGFPTEESEYAETMLELVAGLSVHDRLTRGHSERVRAYTDMIAEEIGLPEESASKLRWAALLHDVGKIYVPAEILNKPGKPTEAEWEVLKSHTWKGDELVEPLKEFLGEWSDTIRNHHDRWDGNGYPDRLAGTDIPLGARIVAVADAYDVMTSARSYKAPRPAEEAREEVARCAGSQFDPQVARAFLNIGLGRLRFAAGPLSWLANIQAATRLPVASIAQPVAAVVTAAVATVVAGSAPAAPPEIAFVAPPITTTTTQPVTTLPPITQPTTTIPPPTTTTTPPPPPEPPLADSGVVSISEDTAAPVVLVASSPTEDVIFSIITAPSHGTIATGNASLPAQIPSNGVEAFVTAQYKPGNNYSGPDSLTFRACNAAAPSVCSTGTISINVVAVDDPPVAKPDSATVAEDGTLILTPAMVLVNDTDVEGDTLTVTWGTPSGVSSVLSGDDLHYIPAENSNATGTVPYQACDSTSCGPVALVTVIVAPSDDQPIALPDTVGTIEDTPLVLDPSLFLGNDIEVDGDPIYISWVPAVGLDTSIEPPAYTPALDSNIDALIQYQLCDPYGCSTGAKVTVEIAPADDVPVAISTFVVPPLLEDDPFATTHATMLSHYTDVDGDSMAVVWGDLTSLPGLFADNGSDIAYVAPADFNGSVTLPYSVCSTTGLAVGACSAPAALTLGFAPVNDAPTIGGLPAAGPPHVYDHIGTESVTSSVADAELLALANDIETPGALTITYTDPDGIINNGPDLIVTPTGFDYTPVFASLADVPFSYWICDAEDCTRGIVNLTFTEVNDPPAPTVLNVAATEDTPITITRADLEAAANDPDTVGTDLTFTFPTLTFPKGTVTRNPVTGPLVDITFTPTPDANGLQTITYTVCDNNTPTPNCQPATIDITLAPVNDAPTIGGLPAAGPPHVYNHIGTESVTSSVTDAELLALATDIETPAALTITYTDPDGIINNGPDLIFTPTGFDYTPVFASLADIPFSYWICDAEDCTRGIVNLTFTEVNDPPAPTVLNTPATEDTPITITRADLETAANDPDTADTDLTFTFPTLTYPKGTVTLNPTTGPLTDLTFTPTPDANGLQTITYTVCDNNTPTPNCQPATIDITLAATPDPVVITGAPSSHNTYDGVAVLLLDDYTYTEPDGEIPWINFAPQPSSPNGTAIVVAGNNVSFLPTPGFTGQTVVNFELCDTSGCVTDPTFGHWDVSVYSADSPLIGNIPDQTANVGVAMNAGPFPVTNPNALPLAYTHTLPTGLSLVEGAGEITLVGVPTDPSLLGTTATYEITVDDSLKASIQTVTITFSAQGLSPHKGKVIFTEVLSHNMDWCDDELGFDICVKAELIEVYNRSGSPIDMSNWSIQDYMPGDSQGGGDLAVDIGPDSTPVGGVTLWPTTIAPSEYVGFNTRWLEGDPAPSDFTTIHRAEDKLWLLDENGLAVDYVGWYPAGHEGHGHVDDILPDPALGLWNVADQVEMETIAGTYAGGQYTSISLATLNDANTAACWEFTGSGGATVGAAVCDEADVFLTTSTPLINPNHSDPMNISHGVANYL